MAVDWRSGASAETLKQRARLLARIRAFFADQLVMEVETPILSATGVSEPHIGNLTVHCNLPGRAGSDRLYLQTSPEYAMKRLLASGIGPIYQICHVFRDGEAGRLHNPEFTMIEWYRPGMDYQDLMEDVEFLLIHLLGIDYCQRLEYGEAFRRHAGIDPYRATDTELANLACRQGVAPEASTAMQRDDWLDLLLSTLVAPQLGRGRPTFLCNYPASQAALARIVGGEPPVAARFELFIEGVEIGNGSEELTDPLEQRARFERDNARRHARGLPEVPIDERLLAALAHGVDRVSGVALGFDRLLMVVSGRQRIDEVMAFSIARA